jgi:hypothetical protein
MSSANYRPVNEPETLIHGLFAQLEGEADPQIAQLHYENQLRRYVAQHKSGAGLQTRRGGPEGPPHFGRRQPKQPMRPAFMLLSVLTTLLLLASWAGEMKIHGWDDGQQITVELPPTFEDSRYVQYVALFANRSNELAAKGGHSLIVDKIGAADGGYLLQLSVLGVDASTANEWFRSVLDNTSELAGARYQLTQPQVSYQVTVKEMLAYKLGESDTIERRVVDAWTLLNSPPTPRGMIYLIAGDDHSYPRRASMLR